jgi:uncharacterized protein YggU (UPF0235/DUF167 family)
MAAVPWSLAPGGGVLAVRLTPKGGRDAIEGVEKLADGRAVLAVRVRSLRAPPPVSSGSPFRAMAQQ